MKKGRETMNRIARITVMAAGVGLVLGVGVLADVPPPPANQLLGMEDVSLGNLTEADCRPAAAYPWMPPSPARRSFSSSIRPR